MPLDRRTFLAASLGCAAHLGLQARALSAAARRGFGRATMGDPVAREPWGHLDRVGEDVWALVSTPLAGPRGSAAWRTICNGGIVAGREAVLLIEGFGTPEGAAWMAAEARRLTGREATHVVLTHFHSDHSGGLSAYDALRPAPVQLATQRTRDLLVERASPGVHPSVPSTVLPADAQWTLDLGGRSVRATPRAGHTPSDVSLEVDDPAVLFCGDLVWNGMFPNYVDAIPSLLSRHVRALATSPASVFVPGHGSLADRDALARYTALIDDVEAAARRAFEAGIPSEEAAKTYVPPASLGEWTTFSPAYYQRALAAWERELSDAGDR